MLRCVLMANMICPVPSQRVLYKWNVLMCCEGLWYDQLKPGCHDLAYQARPSLTTWVMSRNSQWPFVGWGGVHVCVSSSPSISLPFRTSNWLCHLPCLLSEEQWGRGSLWANGCTWYLYPSYLLTWPGLHSSSQAHSSPQLHPSSRRCP